MISRIIYLPDPGPVSPSVWPRFRWNPAPHAIFFANGTSPCRRDPAGIEISHLLHCVGYPSIAKLKEELRLSLQYRSKAEAPKASIAPTNQAESHAKPCQIRTAICAPQGNDRSAGQFMSISQHFASWFVCHRGDMSRSICRLQLFLA